jgi:integrase
MRLNVIFVSLIEVPENLKEWLLPYADRSGKLWSLSHMQFYRDLEAARANAGISKWPSNALRHSYASYHLAFHQNAAALALQMGHTSQAMIFLELQGISHETGCRAVLAHQTCPVCNQRHSH